MVAKYSIALHAGHQREFSLPFVLKYMQYAAFNILFIMTAILSFIDRPNARAAH